MYELRDGQTVERNFSVFTLVDENDLRAIASHAGRQRLEPTGTRSIARAGFFQVAFDAPFRWLVGGIEGEGECTENQQDLGDGFHGTSLADSDLKSSVVEHGLKATKRHGITIATADGIQYGLPMKTKVTMDRAGRLVLPRSIRQSLNTPPTAVFEAEVFGNRIELTLSEDQTAKPVQRGKLLVIPKQGKTVDVLKAIDETRKDRW